MNKLKHRLAYITGAIKYHTRHNNIEQVRFYQSELELIEMRLAKTEKTRIALPA